MNFLNYNNIKQIYILESLVIFLYVNLHQFEQKTMQNSLTYIVKH